MWKMVTAKVTAISDLRSPTNIGECADLWAGNMNGELLGTLPAPSDQHLATTTQLTLTKGVPCPWSQTLQKSFDFVRLMLTQAPVMTFNPSRELVVENHASEYGLGSVLIQRGKPAAYNTAADICHLLNVAMHRSRKRC